MIVIQPTGKPISRTSKQGFHVHFIKTKINIFGTCVHTQKLPNEKGIAITLFLSEDSLEKIKQIDEQTLQLAIANNDTWFQNGLSEVVICDYFKPSIRHPCHMTLIIPYSSSPSKILYGNESYHNFTELMDAHNLLQQTISVRLIPRALRYYAKSCGIVWFVDEIILQDDEEDEVIIERDELETFWSKRVQETSNKIQEDIDALNKLQTKIEGCLNDAKKCDNTDEHWNSTLEILGQYCLEYEGLRTSFLSVNEYRT